ncbi:uncharacterized protein V1518DRAFT_367874, partial [Limtongia smithiae]|uniref:uncharacterized protein n=1 Tax=Limtongia smithiae TaxID=1125753 RepID=UPI0034CEB056
MSSVVVTNIDSSISRQQIYDFFAFCGKIDSLDVSEALDRTTNAPILVARVRFVQEEAGKTALLLTDTLLGSRNVQVSEDMQSHPEVDARAQYQREYPPPGGAREIETGEIVHDVPQEDKPKAAVIAELLSHGYALSDKAVQKSQEFDQRHGFSNRFSRYLTDIDSKYNISARAQQSAQTADSKYNILGHVHHTQGILHKYFDKAMDSDTGARVRLFYSDASKNVADVHNEARRLANIREGKPNG